MFAMVRRSQMAVGRKRRSPRQCALTPMFKCLIGGSRSVRFCIADATVKQARHGVSQLAAASCSGNRDTNLRRMPADFVIKEFQVKFVVPGERDVGLLKRHFGANRTQNASHAPLVRNGGTSSTGYQSRMHLPVPKLGDKVHYSARMLVISKSCPAKRRRGRLRLAMIMVATTIDALGNSQLPSLLSGRHQC